MYAQVISWPVVACECIVVSFRSSKPLGFFLAKCEIDIFLIFYPTVHQAGGARCLTTPPGPSGQPCGPANPVLMEDESFHFNHLRVRANEAERRLRVVEANAAILKSQHIAMVERENFLLSEMRQLSEHLLCKFHSFPVLACSCPS